MSRWFTFYGIAEIDCKALDYFKGWPKVTPLKFATCMDVDALIEVRYV